MDLEGAAVMLREAGWTVLPPPAEKPPEPQVGQVWVSPKRRVEPRTVVKIGPHRCWSGDVECVHFTAPSDAPSKWGPRALHRAAWDSWVKKSGARPA